MVCKTAQFFINHVRKFYTQTWNPIWNPPVYIQGTNGFYVHRKYYNKNDWRHSGLQYTIFHVTQHGFSHAKRPPIKIHHICILQIMKMRPKGAEFPWGANMSEMINIRLFSLVVYAYPLLIPFIKPMDAFVNLKFQHLL